ncbi:MAG: YqgE/AlgH family protein [Alphaproteobacteria bacterium]
MAKRPTQNITAQSLAGHLLIATPAVQDFCFNRSVIYLCSHTETGAMGVIVNYPVKELQMNQIYEQLDISNETNSHHFPIHFGGPVEANRGFIIHSSEFEAEGSLIEMNGISVSASLGLLKAIAAGKGPRSGMLVLGYAGWSSGQLESEIESGSWMVVPATKELVFGAVNETKWDRAIATLGIDMGHFSGDVGHA